MPMFVPGPLTSRSWAIPIPVPGIARGSRLQRAVAGRTVVVTGASSGIGEATARKLGAAGAVVLLVARRQEKLDALAAEIREAGGTAFAHAGDLSDGDDSERLVEEILAAHGGVDVLINNAGHSIRRSVGKSIDRPHDYERTIALNYLGAVRLTLGFLPGMRKRRRGQIVNVSTMGVQFGVPRFSAYVASKAALDAFTRVLAAEVEAYGIRCTTVHMPLVRTPMIEPTKAYRGVPAMSPDGAAELVCEALRSRPRAVDLPIGALGEIADAVVPGLMTRAMHYAYRATPRL